MQTLQQTLPFTKRIVCGVMNLSQYDTQNWLLAKMTAAFGKIAGTRTYKKRIKTKSLRTFM